MRKHGADMVKTGRLVLAPLSMICAVSGHVPLALANQPAPLAADRQQGPPEPALHSAMVPAANGGLSGDPVLDDLLRLAVSGHPAINAARLSARAAGVDVRAAKWLRFPSISVEGQLLDQRNNRTQVQAVVDMPLWAAGRVGNTVARAKARAGAAQAGFDEAVQSVGLAVVQSYYDIHRARERVRILGESLQRHQDMVASMERRVAQEVSPLSDLELARTRALQIEQQIFQSRAQANSALRRLRELVYDPALDPVSAMAQLTDWPLFDEADVIDQATGFDPRLRRLESESSAADFDARVARAATLPQVSGQYSYSEVVGHRVGVVLKAQTEGGLSRFATAEASRLRQQSSEFQVESARRDLREQLVADLQDYESSRNRAANSTTAAGAARRVQESYMRQFFAGRRGWLDVMNAVREATSTEIDALDAGVGSSAALARISLRSGLWRLDPDAAGEPQP